MTSLYSLKQSDWPCHKLSTVFFSSSQVVAEHLEAFSADFHKYVPLVKGDPDVIVEIIPTAEFKVRGQVRDVISTHPGKIFVGIEPAAF